MSMWLRQSTAGQEILLGPFVDDTDGKTPETALSIANTDIKLWKEDATIEANKNSGGATHIASGRYYAVLDATDTNTLGKLEVNVVMTGALPVRREYMVVPAVVYDAIIKGTDNLDVNTVQVGGTVQTAGDIVDELADIKGATFNTSIHSLEAIRNNHPANFVDMSIELATGKVSITDSDLANIVAEIDLSSTTIANIQSRIPTISSAAIFESYLDGSEYFPVDPYKIDFSVSGTTLTVRKPNDVTIAYTKTLGTDAGALPVVSSV